MQVKNKKYSKLIHDSGENKEHYKMYKTTKGWLFAGITLFTFGAGFTFGPYAVQANDNTSNAENESSVVTSSTSSSSAAASSENSSVASTSSLNAPSKLLQITPHLQAVVLFPKHRILIVLKTHQQVPLVYRHSQVQAVPVHHL